MNPLSVVNPDTSKEFARMAMVLNKLKILFFQHAMTVDRSPQLGHFTQQNEANAPNSAGFEKEKPRSADGGGCADAEANPTVFLFSARVRPAFDPGSIADCFDR